MSKEFEAITALPNGAHFVGADLHVHTYGGSRDVTDEAMTPDAIVRAAVAKGLRILAITDHNTGQNVRAALEVAQTLDADILVVPGVEITTSNGHLLAYFETPDLVDKLLARIEIKDRGNASDGRTEKSMASVLQEVDALGGFGIAAHIDRKKTGFEEFVDGYQGGKRDIVLSACLRGVEVDNKEHLHWYSQDDAGTNSAERKKLLSARASSHLHADLGHVQGSDAHSLKSFEGASVAARIKIDQLSFKALETAFHDPGARVRAMAPLPTSYPRIVGMSVDGGFIAGELFHLSKNLNCFFGGRGTGKSTALRTLAHALGFDAEFEKERSDYPSRIAIYVEDEHGMVWFYEKLAGEECTATGIKRATTLADADSFPIEYYPQNALSKVADNLTEDGARLQGFLDAHLHQQLLFEREESLLALARQAAVLLEPLEAQNDGLTGFAKKLSSVDALLKSAEEGKLKDVVAHQAQLANERTMIQTLLKRMGSIRAATGKLDVYVDLNQIVGDHSPLLQTPKSREWHEWLRNLYSRFNVQAATLKEKLFSEIDSTRKNLEAQLGEVEVRHNNLQKRIDDKIANFEKEGLTATTQGLKSQIAARERLAQQIAQIKEKRSELETRRAERKSALDELASVRSDIEKLRREQLAPINRSLANTIDQFKVNFLYDSVGLATAFERLIQEVMHGSHMGDEEIAALCRQTLPQELATICRDKSVQSLDAILEKAKVATRWSSEIVKRFQNRKNLHELESCWKPPIVRIRVRTKTEPSREIPIANLSDGQRHTVLLTVAMLGHSTLPLLIDQPEDDLDNAFISRTVVDVLRRVKERRQVIVVTHNANIVVLGDAEQLFPMERRDECGRTHDIGSIDRGETRKSVEESLEGGRDAFRRRAEIYGLP